MKVMVNREQEVLWESIEHFLANHELEKAQTILKLTVEQSLQRLQVESPFLNECHIQLNEDTNLEPLKELDLVLSDGNGNAFIEVKSDILLDYFDFISQLTEVPKITNKKLIASYLNQCRDRKRTADSVISSSFLSLKDTGEKYVTTSDVAKRLGVSDQTVRRMCETDKIPGAYKTNGGHWRIPSSIFILSEEQEEKVTEMFASLDKKNRKAGVVDEFDL